MTFQLRDYQKAAVDGVYQYWTDKRGDNPLIVAPTGAGKSLILAKIIQDVMEFPQTKVMVLTHVKELLEQNAEKLATIAPNIDFGFYSASIGQKRLDKPVVFAGIQSVWQKAFDMIPPPDVVLIDEAHMLPKKTTTRYGKFIEDLKTANPKIKVVGLTATPYRLDSGYLHKGDGAIFDGIAYDIPVGMLMDEGFLSPVISKGGDRKIDLSNVKKRGGEFLDSDLAIAASDPELVAATVQEIVEQGQSRKAWLVFSSGIAHANMLADGIRERGVAVEVVTGSDNKTDRERKIADFRAGRTRCLVNCDVLTTGFDVPIVDLVAIVRATASPGLYVQMVGRGTRLADGKENCLVLDYGQNVERHGFIDAVKPPAKSGGSGDGEAPSKECPSCQHIVPAGCRNCPECDHEFPPPQLNHGHKSYSGALLSSQVQNEWLDVNDVIYQKWSKQGKPDSVRVTYDCGLTKVSEWLCPDHGGFAASRYHARMPALKADAKSTADALNECHMWVKPSRICVRPDGKWHQIVQLDYTQVEKEEPQHETYESWDEIPF